jgi:hypothetical protein
VRNGATDEDLMAKHDISVNELEVVFRKLAEADLLTASDLVDAAKVGCGWASVPVHRCGWFEPTHP